MTSSITVGHPVTIVGLLLGTVTGILPGFFLQVARYRGGMAPGLPEKETSARDEGNIEGQSVRYRVSLAPGLPEEGTAARDEGDVEGQSAR